MCLVTVKLGQLVWIVPGMEALIHVCENKFQFNYPDGKQRKQQILMTQACSDVSDPSLLPPHFDVLQPTSPYDGTNNSSRIFFIFSFFVFLQRVFHNLIAQ